MNATGRIGPGPRRTLGGRTLIRASAEFALRLTRRNVLHWASWVVALGLELGLMVALRGGQIYGWEQALTRRLQAVPGKQIVFDVTSELTNTLSVPFVVLLLTIATVVYLNGNGVASLMLLLSFPLHVLAQFPKALIERPRPSPEFPGIEGVGGYQSFPSGHSEYVITFYGFLACLLMLHVASRRGQVAIATGIIAFTLATGFGRIALGRHWPLDVLASYVVGLGLLSGLIWLHSAITAALQEPDVGPNT